MTVNVEPVVPRGLHMLGPVCILDISPITSVKLERWSLYLDGLWIADFPSLEHAKDYANGIIHAREVPPPPEALVQRFETWMDGATAKTKITVELSIDDLQEIYYALDAVAANPDVERT